MDDIIVIAIIAAVLGLVIWYIIRAKKSGKKCIGCPDGGCSSCKGKCDSTSCSCGCGGTDAEK